VTSASLKFHVPDLLQREDPRGIRSLLDLRGEPVAPGRLKNEIGSTSVESEAGSPGPVATTGKAPIRGPLAEIPDSVHKLVALDVKVERHRRTHLEGDLAAVPDRLDRDDLRRRAGDSFPAS
jgi:hypothetical protein